MNKNLKTIDTVHTHTHTHTHICNLKDNNHGITLSALIITVVVLVIISATTLYTITEKPNTQELNYMYEDVENLNNKIITYYTKYNTLPIIGDIVTIPEDMETGVNDNSNYYEIDLSKLENVSLHFGSKKEEKDYYIVNEKSHKVYYLNGIEYDGSMYYTKKQETEEIKLESFATVYKSKHPELNLPQGFKWIEGTVDDGYVIQNLETKDEFVWIPVPYPVASSEAELTEMIAKERYPMAVKTSGQDQFGRDNYRGALYDFDINGAGTAVTVTARSYNQNSGRREPANALGKTTIDDVEYILDSQEMFTRQNAGIWYETMYQEEYNELVASVIKNGGFWVGRFESGSLNSDKAVSKMKISNIGGVDWYKAYKVQKNIYGDNSSNNTHMIWGSQWDQIMIWMRNVSNRSENVINNKPFFILNSIDMGVYSNNRSTLWDGTTGKFKVNGIYDLAGNCWEYTMILASSSERAQRSGGMGYDGSTRPAITYSANSLTYVGQYTIGSRMTLYVSE